MAIKLKKCFFPGMGVSSFAIIYMKLKLEWHSIIFTSLGGITGIIFGNFDFDRSTFKKYIPLNFDVVLL
jgi:hypothetical protein